MPGAGTRARAWCCAACSGGAGHGVAASGAHALRLLMIMFICMAKWCYVHAILYATHVWTLCSQPLESQLIVCMRVHAMCRAPKPPMRQWYHWYRTSDGCRRQGISSTRSSYKAGHAIHAIYLAAARKPRSRRLSCRRLCPPSAAGLGCQLSPPYPAGAPTPP